MSKEEKRMNKRGTSYWGSIPFMIRMAWTNRRPILIFAVLIVLMTAGQRILELLVSPMILSAVETKAGIGKLFGTIAFFTFGIMLTSSVRKYLEKLLAIENSYLNRVLEHKVADKYTRTSYVHLSDPDVEAKMEKAVTVFGYGDPSYHGTFWSCLIEIVWNIFGFVFFGIILFNYRWWLMVLITGLSVVGWLLSYKMEAGVNDSKNMESIYRNFRQCWYMVDVMYDPAKGKDIRIFHMQSWLHDIYQKILATMWNWYRKRELAWFGRDIVELLAMILRNGLGYAVLIYSVLHSQITVPEFLLYMSAVGGFSSWISGELKALIDIKVHCIDIKAGKEMLNYPEPFRFEGGIEIPRETIEEEGCEITLENVSFRYRGAEEDALQHINLTIHPHEKIALVGLNGAGKTTLVKLICGLLDPTEGIVKLNGIDIREFNREDYYEVISAIFQDYEPMKATIADNITSGSEEYDEETLWKVLDYAGLKEKVASLPRKLSTMYGTALGEYINTEVQNEVQECTFSGGEEQRLILARAYYKKAPILVLDEPTAALDPISESEFYQKYSQIAEKHTSVFVSHRLASTRFCDRILYLEKGSIKEEGSHQQLMDLGGEYTKLFKVQSQYYQEEEKAVA